MEKNQIILDGKTGKIKNIIFDDGDLSKTTADMMADLKTINNQAKLMLLIDINNKFEIKIE